jgi:hypothetical protein
VNHTLFDLFLSYGEGGKRLSKQIAQRISNLSFTDSNGDVWTHPRVPTLNINFSHDATNISVDEELVHDMGGSGRQAEKAIQYYKTKRDRIRTWLWDNFNKHVPQRIWVAACLGGGVGTGSIALGLQDLFDWIECYKEWLDCNEKGSTYKPIVYLLLTLPKPSEGSTLKRTAFKYMNDLIHDRIRSGDIMGTVLVDNGTAEILYGSNKGDTMWDNINNGIVKALEHIYTIPLRSDIDWSHGYKRFDFNDLITTLSFGNGFIDLRNSILKEEDVKSWVDTHDAKDELGKPLKTPEVKTNSLICSSHDINTTNRFAVIVGIPSSWVEQGHELAPHTMDYVDYLIKSIVRKARCNSYINSSYLDPNLTEIQITIICSGMPLSQKIYKMLNSIARDMINDRNKKKVEPLNLAVFDDLKLE